MVRLYAYKPVITSAENPENGTIQAIARLCGECASANYDSSGSEHNPDSACLADLVFGFMEEDDDDEKEGGNNNEIGDCGRSRCNCLNGTGEPCSVNISETEDCASNSSIAEDDSNALFNVTDLKEILQDLVSSLYTNSVEAHLFKEAVTAVEIFKVNQDYKINENDYKFNQQSWLKRHVMNHLRGLGYNAGICKSRRENTKGFPGGNYEYIDVIVQGEERLFVDIDFRMEFGIARPSTQYSSLVQTLPEIFVGKANRLKQIIQIMCDSARKSLKKKGLHLSPWRKYKYMQAKWLGPYRRTTNAVPRSSHQSPHELLGREIGSTALKGRGWNHGFRQQMELCYDKARREDLKSKGKLHRLQVKSGPEMQTEWMPPAVNVRRVCAERTGKVSALAYALKGSSLSSMLPQNAKMQEA